MTTVPIEVPVVAMVPPRRGFWQSIGDGISGFFSWIGRGISWVGSKIRDAGLWLVDHTVSAARWAWGKLSGAGRWAWGKASGAAVWIGTAARTVWNWTIVTVPYWTRRLVGWTLRLVSGAFMWVLRVGGWGIGLVLVVLAALAFMGERYEAKVHPRTQRMSRGGNLFGKNDTIRVRPGRTGATAAEAVETLTTDPEAKAAQARAREDADPEYVPKWQFDQIQEMLVTGGVSLPMGVTNDQVESYWKGWDDNWRKQDNHQMASYFHGREVAARVFYANPDYVATQDESWVLSKAEPHFKTRQGMARRDKSLTLDQDVFQEGVRDEFQRAKNKHLQTSGL